MSTVNTVGMARRAQQQKDGALLGRVGIDMEISAPRGHHNCKKSSLASHIEK